MNAILVWRASKGWARSACAGPGGNSLASAGIPSFPDHGISGAERDSLGLGDVGSKKLKGKEPGA